MSKTKTKTKLAPPPLKVRPLTVKMITELVEKRGCVAVTDMPFYVSSSTFNEIAAYMGLKPYAGSIVIWCKEGASPLGHPHLRPILEALDKFLSMHRGSGVLLYKYKIEKAVGKSFKLRDMYLALNQVAVEAGCLKIDGGNANAFNSWLCPTERVRELVRRYLGGHE